MFWQIIIYTFQCFSTCMRPTYYIPCPHLFWRTKIWRTPNSPNFTDSLNIFHYTAFTITSCTVSLEIYEVLSLLLINEQFISNK